jgi:hypothetical protein
MRKLLPIALALLALVVAAFALVAFLMRPGYDPAMEPYYALARQGRGPEYAEWIIEPGVGIGPLKFGMTREEVIAILGEPELAEGYEEGGMAPYWSLGTLLFFSEEDQLRSIQLGADAKDSNSPLIEAVPFRLESGVGFASSKGEVLAALGPPMSIVPMSNYGIEMVDDFTIWIGKPQMTMLFYLQPRISFDFVGDRLVSIHMMKSPTPRKLKPWQRE